LKTYYGGKGLAENVRISYGGREYKIAKKVILYLNVSISQLVTKTKYLVMVSPLYVISG